MRVEEDKDRGVLAWSRAREGRAGSVLLYIHARFHHHGRFMPLSCPPFSRVFRTVDTEKKLGTG